MSILNIWPSPTAAIVACDTAFAKCESGRESLGVGSVPKMLPLVHLGAVMAGRGNMLFLLEAWRFAAGGLYSSFDHLLDDLEGLYARSAEGAAAVAASVGAAAPETGELAVVGFSPRARAVVSVVLMPAPEGSDLERFELLDSWLTPSDDAVLLNGGFAPAPLTAQEAGGILRQQVELYRSPCQPALGAPFVVATVTRNRVSIELIP